MYTLFKVKSKFSFCVVTFLLFLSFTVFGNHNLFDACSGVDNVRRFITAEDTLRGIVKTENNEILIGASVLIKGTTTGTVTDEKGRFTLLTNEISPTLIISYLGYITKEVQYQGSLLEVQLIADKESLQEVVVVGYGTQHKKDVVGVISSLSSKEISELPVTNFQQVLQGRVPGVDVVTTGRNPGSGVNVRIRGRRSLSAGNEPLYVVDGVPMAGSFNDFNTDDIASIEVLRDAAATAIYGSRAANGVVLVTTKRGKPGRSSVFYNAYYGISTPMEKVDVMNGLEYAEYKRESRRAISKYTNDSTLFDSYEYESLMQGRYTDYQSLILKNGVQQNHNVGIAGGTEDTKYYISGSYFNEIGVVPGLDFNRYSFRMNLDQQVSRKLKVGMSSLTSYNITNNGFNPMVLATLNSPLGKPYNEDGSLNFRPTGDPLNTNPLFEIIPGAYIRENKKFRSFNNLFAEYEVLKGLRYRLNFAPDFQFLKRNEFSGRLTNLRREGDPTARGSVVNSFSYTLEHLLTYNKQLNKDHGLNLTGLYSIQNYKDEPLEVAVTGVPVETQESYNLGAASIINSVGSNYLEWSLISYLGRVNYNFRNKYLATFTTRVDQSSRFSEKNRTGVFPSVALGWNLSEENFLKDLGFISNIKLRMSYGETGNTEIRPYQTHGELSKTVYAFGNNSAYGFRPLSFPNKDLKWETTVTGNLGLDIDIFKGRFSASIDVYRQKTKDLLMFRRLPANQGFAGRLENVGKTTNAGLEFQLSSVNVNHHNSFKWTTDIIWSKNYEEIVSLYGGKENDVGNNWFIGEPLTSYFDYEKIGIWQLEEKDLASSYKSSPGKIKVKDQNNDGKINADDRVILGSDVPDWIGGITNRFEFKGIDFSFFIYARKGGMIRSLLHGTNNLLAGRNNNLDVNYWTPDNPTNDYPRPSFENEIPDYASSMTYFDGSFIKVRNITLGYTFSDPILNKLRMRSLRIYASAQQPFVFSSYQSKHKGVDPEFARGPNAGVEQVSEIGAMTPSSRLFFGGLNIMF